ncbi:REP-associated tyrosine transposase [Marivirga harenae]|uniref:REP-associated tyrosine transposase n=1 Tax=Marivirga harenae TaxID=2010992 RepID=UPI0026DF582A|nr:transposase [Marivirga harenae]WKV12640.1 transposase [Marivirga harenae]
MGFEYVVKDQGAPYFVTFTVHQWVDVFTRKIYSDLLIESIDYCQQHKGLKVYAWVIMSNHCHFILQAADENLSDVIRDFKKFTSKKIFKAIKDNPKESRRAWLLRALSYKEKIWFWKEGYHGEEIVSSDFFESKLNYIHMNPVKAGIVEKEEDYLLSSAGCYSGLRSSCIPIADYG